MINNVRIVTYKYVIHVYTID